MKKLFLITFFITSASFFILCTAQYTMLSGFYGRNGEYPWGNVILSGKTLYGMATRGGSLVTAGCVYAIDTDGTNNRVLLNFNDTNGSSPFGSLILAGKRLYGMTSVALQYGNIFSINTDGSGFKNLLYFNDTNGEQPRGSLIIAGNMLYGMAGGGGHDSGCIFAIDTNGNSYKRLFDFTKPKGAGPQGSLILNGKVMYGMTGIGGIYNDGVVFSIDTDGTHYKKLLDFDSTNGEYPVADLTYASGKLYGMTESGGGHHRGCIFSIDTNGSAYKDLYDFPITLSSGGSPDGSLTLVGKTLYGTTPGVILSNGIYNGSIFSIDTDGNNFTTMFNFPGVGEIGENPLGGSMAYSSGKLYGTTYGGGDDNLGVIFKIDTGTVSTLSVNNLTEKEEAIKVYPNPCSSVFTIQINGLLAPKGLIEIYNVLGQQVYQTVLNANNAEINLSGQPNGVYLYRVIIPTGNLVGEGKIVIQH